MKSDRDRIVQVLLDKLALRWVTQQEVASEILALGIPTIRDQFAMAALQGLLACPEQSRLATVELAYKLADEMMEARK